MLYFLQRCTCLQLAGSKHSGCGKHVHGLEQHVAHHPIRKRRTKPRDFLAVHRPPTRPHVRQQKLLQPLLVAPKTGDEDGDKIVQRISRQGVREVDDTARFPSQGFPASQYVVIVQVTVQQGRGNSGVTDECVNIRSIGQICINLRHEMRGKRSVAQLNSHTSFALASQEECKAEMSQHTATKLNAEKTRHRTLQRTVTTYTCASTAATRDLAQRAAP
jgi:hypothetical protein